MTLLLFADAAYPPRQVPSGVTGICGYIGGDTPHVWTAADWASQKARYRLPVYTRSNPPGPGAQADVAEAVAQLGHIGCPKGKLVAWDMETAADAAYIKGVYGDLSAAGWKVIVYGSESSVLGNDNPDGLYWAADWTNVPHMAGRSQITQYVSFASYDLSEAESALPFWDTAPPAPPRPQVSWIEGTVRLPEITPGMTDGALPHWYIHRVQAILNDVYGDRLSVDGKYGPASEAAIKALQVRYGIKQDGVIGAATWQRLAAG